MDGSVFWTAVAAAGQVIAAGVTVWAVIVALRQGRIGREQFLQARHDDARPVLIVTSDPSTINTQQGNTAWLDWSNQHQIVKVQNVGKGIALHVRGVIYGPGSVVVQSYPQPRTSDTHASDVHWTYWKSDIVRPVEEKELDHRLGASIFSAKNKHIQQYSFNAPKQPLNPQQEPTCICRLCLTYHDLFRRKHASIFDLVLNSGWQVIDNLEEIPQDLQDLEG
jgi:hypothetical protein